MKAFITGGTGLLGANLVDLLLKGGHAAKVLARSEQKAGHLARSPKLEVVKGDLTDIPRFADELAGCDVVFHCAAYYREYSDRGDHRQALQRLNVEATLELLEECRARKVANFVFVSSNGATGVPANGEPQNEACGYDELTENLYFKSKIDAEKAVDAYRAQHPEMRIVVIRPAMMIGPNDRGPTPAGQVVLRMLRGEMPVILPGSIVVVDARDVARALLSAAARGASGDRFIVGGRAVTFLQLAETLQAVSGATMPKRRPPYALAMAMLAVASLAGAVTGRSVPVRPRDLKRMRRLRAPDSSKAQRVLGIEFRDLADSLKDAADWFRAQEP